MSRPTLRPLGLRDHGPIYIIAALESLILLPGSLLVFAAITACVWGAYQALTPLFAGGWMSAADIIHLVTCGGLALLLQVRILPYVLPPERVPTPLTSEEAEQLTTPLQTAKLRLGFPKDHPVELGMLPGPEISVLAGDRDLLGNRFRYICVGTLLLAAADAKNLECYLGHELGHLLSELENKPRHRAMIHKIYDPLLKLLIKRFDWAARTWSFYVEKRKPLRRLKRYAFEYFSDRAAHAVVGAQEFEESFKQLKKMESTLRSFHLKELTHRELSKQNLSREEFQAIIPALLAEAEQKEKETAALQKETHPSKEARIAAIWRREGRTKSTSPAKPQEASE